MGNNYVFTSLLLLTVITLTGGQYFDIIQGLQQLFQPNQGSDFVTQYNGFQRPTGTQKLTNRQETKKKSDTQRHHEERRTKKPPTIQYEYVFATTEKPNRKTTKINSSQNPRNVSNKNQYSNVFLSDNYHEVTTKVNRIKTTTNNYYNNNNLNKATTASLFSNVNYNNRPVTENVFENPKENYEVYSQPAFNNNNNHNGNNNRGIINTDYDRELPRLPTNNRNPNVFGISPQISSNNRGTNNFAGFINTDYSPNNDHNRRPNSNGNNNFENTRIPNNFNNRRENTNYGNAAANNDYGNPTIHSSNNNFNQRHQNNRGNSDFYPERGNSEHPNRSNTDFYPGHGTSNHPNRGSTDFYPGQGTSNYPNRGNTDFYPERGNSEHPNRGNTDFYPGQGTSNHPNRGNTNIYTAGNSGFNYPTDNPLINRPGVRPAPVDVGQPPITNRPVNDRNDFFNRPDVGQEAEILIGPDEDDMTERQKRRYEDLAERMCNRYKSLTTRKVVALPLVPSPDPVELNVSDCVPIKVPLVIGGTVVSIRDFPHMALLGWMKIKEAGYSWKCGGSLVSEQYVLTAGHCTYHEKDYDVVSGPPHAVQLGSSYLNDRDATVVRTSAVIRHPKYKQRRSYHDVALIKLVRKVTFSEVIRPACLGVPPPEGENIIATGWGRTEFGGDHSSELRSVSLPVWDMEECRQIWGTSLKLPGGVTPDSHMCAGVKRGGKDTCQGDSGGPAQIQDGCSWRVVAVTSYGRSCGAPQTPALYAVIPTAFIAAQVFGEQT